MDSRILYFIGGVVAGAAATFFIMKKLTDERIEEEIADVKESYKVIKLYPGKNNITEDPLVNSEAEKAKIVANLNNMRKADMFKNEQIIGHQQYNLFANPLSAKDIHNGVDEDEDLEITIVDDHPRDDLASKPYVITPDQFVNECRFYDKTTLECYDDGVIANALTEEIIEDINLSIGEDSLSRFGEYEEDVVYVRNERWSTDYEVIRQHRPFARIPGEDS